MAAEAGGVGEWFSLTPVSRSGIVGVISISLAVTADVLLVFRFEYEGDGVKLAGLLSTCASLLPPSLPRRLTANIGMVSSVEAPPLPGAIEMRQCTLSESCVSQLFGGVICGYKLEWNYCVARIL